jgi:hypothetical protein
MLFSRGQRTLSRLAILPMTGRSGVSPRGVRLSALSGGKHQAGDHQQDGDDLCVAWLAS